jgi:two-component system OmpR family response regulator
VNALRDVRLLVVEDDDRLVELLSRGLGEEGATVSTAGTVQDGLAAAREEEPDAIVLDVMLPDGAGYEICRALREQGRWTPVLMLTARGEVEDRVEGLEVGADDYLVKPFAFPELVARLRALVRRERRRYDGVLSVGDLRLDPRAQTVERAGTPIELTAREFDVLEYFMQHPGELLSSWRLLEDVFGGIDHDPNLVAVYVRYLRDKIDRPFGRDTLHTVRARGYRLLDDRT